MSLVFNTKTYNANSFNASSVDYIGASKTVSTKDDLVLRRTAAKASSVFSGVGRAQAKLTRTLALTGALTPTGDAIVNIEVSVPVGYTAADVDTLLNDTGALLSGADFKTLVKAQKINY
jgi:hypothetical protein